MRNLIELAEDLEARKELEEAIKFGDIAKLTSCTGCGYPTVSFVSKNFQTCYICEEKYFEQAYINDYEGFDDYLEANELKEISPMCECHGCNAYRDYGKDENLYLVDGQVVCEKHLLEDFKPVKKQKTEIEYKEAV